MVKRYTWFGVGALTLALLPAPSLIPALLQWEALGDALRLFNAAFVAACVELALGGICLLAFPRFSPQALRAAGAAGMVFGGGNFAGMLLGVIPCSSGG